MMNKTLRLQKITYIVLLGLMGVITSVGAQTYPEGRAAYIRGDYEAAYAILKPLAESGDAEAQKMMGIMYDYGHGVLVDPELALQWYIRSAEQGQTAVQYQVGAKYFKGESIPQDYTEAARWWRMAAEGGQVDAQFNLGLMYFRGMGVTQDDEIAAQMFQQAAEQDHGHAQYSLGVMYAFGRGVQRNYTIARDWFTRAADKGIAQAQYNLGIFYENGNGVQPDIEQAREWYQRAAAQGLNEAITKLEGLGAAPREPDPLHEMIDTERENDIPQQAEPVGTEIASAKAGPSYDEDTEPSPTGIKREKWILDQPPDHYTIQIGSITSEEDLVNFLKRHNIENDSAYIQIVIDGVTRYNAFYGLFSNYQEAEQAISGLPGEIQRASPWIRNIRILQRLIN